MNDYFFLMPCVNAFLSCVILGIQVVLYRKQQAIARRIGTLEERVTELELAE